MAAPAALPLLAQSNGHLKSASCQKVAGKRGAAVQVKIPLAVDPGFHVNSNTPNEEYLIPLKLTWKATGALEGGTSSTRNPRQEKYEFCEKPLSVFTGKFDVIANFKVAAERPGRPGSGRWPSSAIKPATTKPASRRRPSKSRCRIPCSKLFATSARSKRFLPCLSVAFRSQPLLVP